jgi:hypothetical protein
VNLGPATLQCLQMYLIEEMFQFLGFFVDDIKYLVH